MGLPLFAVKLWQTDRSTIELDCCFQEELKKMAVKCDLMMIDKFGRLDDLEKLETIHPKVEEITLRMLALQARIQREENEAEEHLRDARDIYVAQLRENTRLVVKTLMLFNEMQTLSASMDSYMRNSVSAQFIFIRLHIFAKYTKSVTCNQVIC